MQNVKQDDFHNSSYNMGDPYRKKIGKLSNYRCEGAHYSAHSW